MCGLAGVVVIILIHLHPLYTATASLQELRQRLHDRIAQMQPKAKHVRGLHVLHAGGILRLFTNVDWLMCNYCSESLAVS